MTDRRPPIPMVDLKRQYQQVRAEIDEAVSRVLSSGMYILGPEVDFFEREMADYIGVAHGIGVASGTDALYLILRALGVGPGDEVITTAFTFIATADSIARCGATPVFADIHPDTFNVDARLVIDRITDRTKAIIMVHLYGQPADFDALVGVAGAGIDIIEDCAQAHGATVHGRKVGGFGRASAFSFFPTKTLGAAGDAGMVCTDDDELAAAVRMLRVHGSRQRYESEEIGINSRLDEMQAAMLRIKLRRLDAWNKERKAIAATYGKWLEGVSTPLVMPGVEHVYHQYTIRSTRRDEIAGGLRSAEIASNIYYPTPLHLQPCFSDLGYRAGDLPVCELAAREVLSLPIFPGMTSEEIDRVCSIANAS